MNDLTRVRKPDDLRSRFLCKLTQSTIRKRERIHNLLTILSDCQEPVVVNSIRPA